MVFVLILRFWTPSPFRTFYTLCCLMIMVTGVCHRQTWTCVILALLVQASGWWIQTHDWNGSCGRGRGRVYVKPELQQWVSGWGDPEIDLQRKSTGPLSCCSCRKLADPVQPGRNQRAIRYRCGTQECSQWTAPQRQHHPAREDHNPQGTDMCVDNYSTILR